SDQRVRVAALVGFGAGSQVGDVPTGDVAGRDVVKGTVNVSGNATIHGPVVATNLGTMTVNYHYTAEEHQRRLEDYVALLRHLAEGEHARALCVAEPPLTNGLPLDKLRLAMARAVLAWDVPLLTLDAPTLQRSLVAALLLPLVTTNLLVFTLRGNWALGRLASNEVAVLVQRQGLAYVGRAVALDRDALIKAHLALTQALAHPVYAVGCARLLEDLAQSEALAVAWMEYQHVDTGPSASPPAAIHLLAAGTLGLASGVGLLLAVVAQLQHEAASEEGAPPAPPTATPREPAPTRGSWRIPVTLAEWQADLDQRNERFGDPAGYWCYVRPGTYRIGGWERDQNDANVALPGFWLARVPVTVAQYAVFMASGGYQEARWWTRTGWHWRRECERVQPWRWDAAPFNHRERQAVSGVTWYEAAAFCCWLGTRLTLPHGYALRLPTEAEWEVAAAYDAAWHRRSYPWGETAPTAREAVVGRAWDEAPPDVATCPNGAAACGALDLAGTVWEWTTGSFAAYPQRAHWLKEDVTLGEYDVPVRGGSYGTSRTNIRCGTRNHDLPVVNYFGLGVRVCVAPLPQAGEEEQNAYCCGISPLPLAGEGLGGRGNRTLQPP
ncbi:MAG: SUMF1/EgtB/PvdO family nonheme iron enzyme, partial [Chloroflexales bacterium]